MVLYVTMDNPCIWAIVVLICCASVSASNDLTVHAGDGNTFVVIQDGLVQEVFGPGVLSEEHSENTFGATVVTVRPL